MNQNQTELEARLAHYERMIRVLRDRIIEIESELVQARTYAVELEDVLSTERSQHLTEAFSELAEPEPVPDEPPEV